MNIIVTSATDSNLSTFHALKNDRFSITVQVICHFQQNNTTFSQCKEENTSHNKLTHKLINFLIKKLINLPKINFW